MRSICFSSKTMTAKGCNINTQPPLLDSEGAGFSTWRRDIELWITVTKVPVNDRATIIYLSLIGKPKITAEQIPHEQLQGSNGVKILLDALADVYIPKKSMRLFNANNNLRNVVRKPGTLVHDFINDFDHAKFKLEQEGLKKDDTLLALELLSQCQLPQDKSQLVMSGISEITYEKMKEKLTSIFFIEREQHNKFDTSDSGSAAGKSDALESVLFSEESISDEGSLFTTGRRNFRGRGWFNPRKSPRGRSYFKRSNRGYGRSQGSKRTNPIGRDGYPTTCAICKSHFHYARECTTQRRNRNESNYEDNTNKINFSMFVGCTSNEDNNRLMDLVNESRGYAILDSGCTNTVCGEEWITTFISNLSHEDCERMVISPSDQKFTFGDGRSVTSKRRVTLPCYMGGVEGLVTTDVVDCSIPLLLSRRSMKRAEMVLDFGRDVVRVNGRDIRLKITNTGHYALPLSL